MTLNQKEELPYQSSEGAGRFLPPMHTAGLRQADCHNHFLRAWRWAMFVQMIEWSFSPKATDSELLSVVSKEKKIKILFLEQENNFLCKCINGTYVIRVNYQEPVYINPEKKLSVWHNFLTQKWHSAPSPAVSWRPQKISSERVILTCGVAAVSATFSTVFYFMSRVNDLCDEKSSSSGKKMFFLLFHF